jgi:hypothetical protein
VGQDGVLHRRRGHARDGHEGDLVDLLEALEAGTLAGAVVLADEERVAVDLAGRLRRFLLLTLFARGRRSRRRRSLALGGARR